MFPHKTNRVTPVHCTSLPPFSLFCRLVSSALKYHLSHGGRQAGGPRAGWMAGRKRGKAARRIVVVTRSSIRRCQESLLRLRLRSLLRSLAVMLKAVRPLRMIAVIDKASASLSPSSSQIMGPCTQWTFAITLFCVIVYKLS